MPHPQPAGATLVVLTAVHLGAQLADPDGPVAAVSQTLLMPALAWLLLASTRSRGRLVRLTALALGFSWLGDTLPRLASGDSGFLVMVGCFLLAQLAYVAAFAPRWRDSVVARPLLLLPYAAGLVALVLLTHEGAGSLFVPVLVYGLALASMAVLATGLGPLAGLGGAVFFISDALIALHAFADLTLPAHGFWVMLTYVVGQTLLVVGVVGVASAGAREAPGGAGPRSRPGGIPPW